MILFLNKNTFQPGGAMKFRPLSSTGVGIVTVNYMYSPAFSASGDILVLASQGSTEVEQQSVHQCLKGMFCPF